MIDLEITTKWKTNSRNGFLVNGIGAVFFVVFGVFCKILIYICFQKFTEISLYMERKSMLGVKAENHLYHKS